VNWQTAMMAMKTTASCCLIEHAAFSLPHIYNSLYFNRFSNRIIEADVTAPIVSKEIALERYQ
jgi:hypothetical protein